VTLATCCSKMRASSCIPRINSCRVGKGGSSTFIFDGLRLSPTRPLNMFKVGDGVRGGVEVGIGWDERRISHSYTSREGK
jgi:hypothetical protein